MSWGVKVWLFYGGFVLFMGGLVALSVQQDFELVQEDYYAAELEYQQVLNASENAKRSDEQATISRESEEVKVSLVSEADSLKVWFMRPSGEKWDLKLNAQNTRYIGVANSKFTPGLYKLKVSWYRAGEAFYHEQTWIY